MAVAVMSVTGSDPVVWAREQGARALATVADDGAVLVRGLPVLAASDLAAVIRQLRGEPMAEVEGFAPRPDHGGGVYGSSQWPAMDRMCMHHERSYATVVPGLLAFACVRPPRTGGVTGLADSITVLDRLPAALTERFERDGWLLRRAYHDTVGLSWADAFGTSDRDAVRRYCDEHEIVAEWTETGLRTSQRRSAVVTHPGTGRRCWFNQIAFLNRATMDADVREYLLAVFGPDGLPFDTCYGDGEPIEPEVIQQINEVYDEHAIGEPWLAGDLLLVDNIRMAHSREVFTGPRELLVAMADPTRVVSAAQASW